MNSDTEQQEFTERELRDFEVEECIQAKLPTEYIKTYQTICKVKNIPEELRLKNTPKQEAFCKMVKIMAKAFKQAMQAQKPAPKLTLKQPNCYFGERAASILDAYESGRQTRFHGMYAERPVAQQYYQSNNIVPIDLDTIDKHGGSRQYRSSSSCQYNSCPMQNQLEVTCHWCGEHGHIRRNCRDRIEAIRKLDEQHG
ncbi:CCHC-type zinc finger transcription factor [Phycomyces blakesleeanus NRRL 1555(-)]|uniref:CCHC-type zinc finger transcription factor n=1 Tax=Phycomyces blakesleeanus (strain ATCC 8743b / DSM 1359 / FGSC 10004 / NBRC 33097 / NRRL 1555) TaxID=763407 RepID=A0A163DPG7_PHYB8|nr:CCHC-type zinc finger transcription factor [Phycomyces blakesleeanus NRRL 1555(-)]OAD72710.1 CCHC-type zinc finger transcription factor [Phycomyces blakesleeanus NRRL 1555(-)]|eukprot:XP_018290750.1 CCHC-type zinc finger transcription factor [Phycomyces blakesleeanus NRRL 1555(-)]